MAKLLKLRRGTTSQHGSFTGAEGEVTIDTTKDTAVVHDGSTAGGRALAREDLTNVSSSTIAGRLNNDSIAVSKIAAGTLPSDVKIQDANVSGNLTIESADIVNGTIVNADINASAAIANSKLADSGVTAGSVGSSSAIPIITVNSKGIITGTSTTAIDSTQIANGTSSVSVANNDDITINRSGTNRVRINNGGLQVLAGNFTNAGNSYVLGGNLYVQATTPIVHLQDTNDNPDYEIKNQGGNFIVRDATNSTDRLTINTSGTASIAGNLDVGAGCDVTGNITCTGTVDGRDVASDGSKLDGIESGATADQTAAEIRTLVGNASDSNVFTDADHAKLDALTTSNGVLVNGVVATTQAAGNETQRIATTAFVATAINNAQAFPSGTKMLFNQTSAPTGWTKQTSGVDNKALRVTSGTVGSGGNQAFGTVFASRNITANAGNTTQGGNISVANATQGGNISVANTTAGGNVTISSVSTSGNVNSHTLSTNEMPSHSHQTYRTGSNHNINGNEAVAVGANTGQGGNRLGPYYSATVYNWPLSQGGGGGHSHGFTGSSHSHNGSLSGTAHNHNATFSGSAHSHNATFSGSAHNHSISVSNLDMQVQYLDVIIASKD